MDNCGHCLWGDKCICVVCEEDSNSLVCGIQHKHVLKTDYCYRFRLNVKEKNKTKGEDV